MKKYGVLFIAMLCMANLVQAQSGRTRFSIGPEIGLAAANPLDEIEGNKGWGLGLGGSLQIEHFFQDKVSGALYAGVIGFAGRSASNNTKNKAYTTIPVRAGINYYIGNQLHLGAQFGVGLNSFNGNSATSFAYGPQIGYNFTRNDKPLDLTLKYDGYAGHGGFGAVGLRLSLIL